MPRRTPSTPKATALPPRTLAKLHRAIAAARPLLEPLETRRLLTSIWLNCGGLVASEDGRYTPQITLNRSDTNGFTDVALSLTGQGANPADASDFTLSADGLSTDLTLISFPSGQTQIPLSLAAVNDDLLEADEVLRVAVADPADPSTPLDSCDVYIKSDDNEIWISGGGLMTENGATVQFTVHREDLGGACTNPASVTVRLKSAGEGELRASLDDYTFSDSVIGSQGPDPDSCLFDLDFAADQATRTITVSANDDANAEPEEWLKLVLLYANLAGDPAQPVPLSATLPTQAFAGITDNDTPLYAPYKLWITGPQNAQLNQDGAQATYTLHRQIEYPWAQPYPIDVSLEADQTGAIPGEHYGLGGEFFTFSTSAGILVSMPADRDQVQFTLTAIDQGGVHPHRPLALTLSSYTRDTDPPVFITGDPDHPTTVNATILDNEPAPAPTNLAATPFANTAITLNWQDNSPNETAFILEKSTDAGANWSQVKVVDANTTTAQIDSLAPGRTYQFRVSAQNANASTQSDPTPAARSNTLPDTQSQIDFLESLSIPVDGSNVTSTITLQDGVEYQLTAHGGAWIDQTYYPDPEIYGYTGDAEYATGNDTVGSGQTEDALFATDVGINVSGAQETDIHWGQHNPAGIYTINLTGTGQPLSFHYRLPSQANPYPDPSAYNSLAVDIAKVTPIAGVDTVETGGTKVAPYTGAFEISRTGSTNASLDVYFHFEGSAVEGSDFESLPFVDGSSTLHKVTIPAGKASKTIAITPIGDPAEELLQSLVLVLDDVPEGSPRGYILGADATTQPTTKPGSAEQTVANLPTRDAYTIDAQKFTDWVRDLDSDTLSVRNSALNALVSEAVKSPNPYVVNDQAIQQIKTKLNDPAISNEQFVRLQVAIQRIERFNTNPWIISQSGSTEIRDPDLPGKPQGGWNSISVAVRVRSYNTNVVQSGLMLANVDVNGNVFFDLRAGEQGCAMMVFEIVDMGNNKEVLGRVLTTVEVVP